MNGWGWITTARRMTEADTSGATVIHAGWKLELAGDHGPTETQT